jgi:hypothetical protein
MAKKKKKKSAPERKPKPPPKPPPKMIIRRNAALSRPEASSIPRNAALSRRAASSAERAPLTRRIEGMEASHVAAGALGGTLGSVVGVVSVGKGWIGPKKTAGILMGAGAAATAAGWYWDADHLMAAGVGMTAAGTFSLANQFSVDLYEAMEKRAEEKQERKEKEQADQDRERRLAEARAMIEAEAKAKQQNMRNGRRIVVVDAEGEVIEHEEQAAA